MSGGTTPTIITENTREYGLEAVEGGYDKNVALKPERGEKAPENSFMHFRAVMINAWHEAHVQKAEGILHLFVQSARI